MPVAVGVALCDPLVALVPDHAPEAVQDVASVLDQVSTVDAPSVRLVGDPVNVSVGAGSLTVSVADPFAVPPLPVQESP